MDTIDAKKIEEERDEGKRFGKILDTSRSKVLGTANKENSQPDKLKQQVQEFLEK